ncbi:MAG TPA: lipopolysaccharide transport periplasmic protein LptA [Aquabacterium sp.]|nr:lipopolysaccharide transport periplasmic protein LptA [Aquabacterium sp.]
MPKMQHFYPSSLLTSAGRRHLGVWMLLGALWTSAAQAEKVDRYQPLNFAADAARVEDQQRLNILTGNVEITKGSMVVRADRVEVRQNPDGTQTATAIGGPGGRAFFRQKREGMDEFIEGEAERVVYDGKTDIVRFTGRALMRRLQGQTVNDQVTGPVIIYDNKTSVFQVVGGPSAGGSSAPSGRVRGVITPRVTETPAASTPEGNR